MINGRKATQETLSQQASNIQILHILLVKTAEALECWPTPFFRPDFYAFPKQPSSHLARNVGIFKRLVRCRTE